MYENILSDIDKSLFEYLKNNDLSPYSYRCSPGHIDAIIKMNADATKFIVEDPTPKNLVNYYGIVSKLDLILETLKMPYLRILITEQNTIALKSINKLDVCFDNV